MYFDVENVSKFVEKIEIRLKSDKHYGYFIDYLCKFMIISRLIIPRMGNISGKSCSENPNTILCSIFLFPKVVYEIKWKNIAEPDWPQMTI